MKKRSSFERMLFKKIEVWQLFLSLLIVLVVAVLLGARALNGLERVMQKEKLQVFDEVILEIVSFPNLVKKVFKEIRKTEALGFTTQKQILSRKNSGKYLDIVDEHFKDDGYLLVSGYRAEERVSVIYLYSLTEQKILHKWIPPVEEINEMSPDYVDELNRKENYNALHPLLLPGGDVVFGSGEGPLVRMDPCGDIKWVINKNFHHSLELTSEGNIIATLTHSPNIAPIPERDLKDDGYVVISPEGEILESYSLGKILIDNGYLALFYGIGERLVDRIHLNDAEPILRTDQFVQEGDVLLSAKHLSSIIQYRPSTNKIIRLKIGPWTNQHDVDYLGNGFFSVFGNDSTWGWKYLNESSSIYEWNASDDSTRVLFPEYTKSIKTMSGGIQRVLPNGDLFIEETDNSILYRIGKDGVRWRFMNILSKSEIGSLHWSRYLRPNEVNLEEIRQYNCQILGRL